MNLHPTLARLAAQYDQIVRDYRDGRISETDAHSRIKMLAARDDTGVFWRINPTDGKWLRQTVYGDWVEGTPPESGLYQPTPFQLSGQTDVVGQGLRFSKVDESLSHPPGSLEGATRSLPVSDERTGSMWSHPMVAAGLGVLLLLVLTFVLKLVF